MAIGSGSTLPLLTSISTSARAGSVGMRRSAPRDRRDHQHRLQEVLHAAQPLRCRSRADAQNISLGSKLTMTSAQLRICRRAVVGRARSRFARRRAARCSSNCRAAARRSTSGWPSILPARSSLKRDRDLAGSRPSSAGRHVPAAARAGRAAHPSSLCDSFCRRSSSSPPSEASSVERLAPPPDGFSLLRSAATSSALNSCLVGLRLGAASFTRLVGVLAVRRLGGLRPRGGLRLALRGAGAASGSLALLGGSGRLLGDDRLGRPGRACTSCFGCGVGRRPSVAGACRPAWPRPWLRAGVLLGGSASVSWLRRLRLRLDGSAPARRCGVSTGFGLASGVGGLSVSTAVVADLLGVGDDVRPLGRHRRRLFVHRRLLVALLDLRDRLRPGRYRPATPRRRPPRARAAPTA